MISPCARSAVRMTRASSCPLSPAVPRVRARAQVQDHTHALLTAVFPEDTDSGRELFDCFELLYGKGTIKREKYGNLVGGIVCGFVGGASGLHSAQIRNFNLNAKCLPGGQSGQNRDSSTEKVRLES
jgi:hypothetical protein